MQIPDMIDFPIIQEILGERDRGAAVVAAGFLESKLTEVIEASLRDDREMATRLLKPSGPLGGFQNKVFLGYMLKLYRKETCDDLVLIAEIRNRFAHRPEPLTFDSAFIRERCEKLTLYQRVWSVLPKLDLPARPYSQAAARRMYLETISLAANFFHHQARHPEFRTRAEELLPI